jgi:hypothetical protein
MVRDENGGKSEWSNPISVSMPRSKEIRFQLLDWIFQMMKIKIPVLNFI